MADDSHEGAASYGPPLKKRRQGQTPTPQDRAAAEHAFIKRLSLDANISAACKAASIDKSTAYEWRKNSTEFADAWEAAISQAVGELEAVAVQRAKATSDLLLMFLLKAHKPDKYRETAHHTVEGDINITINKRAALTERSEKEADA